MRRVGEGWKEWLTGLRRSRIRRTRWSKKNEDAGRREQQRSAGRGGEERKKGGESVDGSVGRLVASRVSVQSVERTSSEVLKSQMPPRCVSNFKGEAIYKLPG